MALDKVIDSNKLDNDLTAIADSIRAKSGTAESLNFPNDFVSAIDNIPKGGGTEEIEQMIDSSGVLDSTEGTVEEKVEQLVDLVEENLPPRDALFVFKDYDETGYPTTLVYNCPDTETMESIFTKNSGYVGQFNYHIKKVIMPDYVTKISKQAFCGMSGIEEVSNWDNITYIDGEGFGLNNGSYDKGKKLKHTYLPPNLTYIGGNAFFRNLVKIVEEIPETVTYIGVRAFNYGGSRDWEITKLPPNLTYIGDNAFWCYRRLLITEIPKTVTYIGNDAFNGIYDNTSLTKLTFKGTPATIGTTAFTNNTALTDIYCPWVEGAVANAPWGATNATIHYNYVEGENTNADS